MPVILDTYTTGTSINSVNLVNSSTYYWRACAFDNAGNQSTFTGPWSFIIDTTPPTVPILVSPLNGMPTDQVSIAFSWSAQDIGPSGIKNYEITISTSITDFFACYDSITVQDPVSVTLALGANTYYWKVKATDNAMNSSVYSSTSVFFVDLAAPQISSNSVSGGDLTWRNSAKTGGYNVSFADPAGLLNAYYTIYTGPGMTGSMCKDWTPIFTNLNQTTYTQSWQVDFTSLQEGGTNFVSVKLADTLGHSATYYDIFFVLVDLTKPYFINNMPGGSDSTWRSSDPGAVYNVNFFDLPANGSKLSKLQTQCVTASGQTLWNWTDTITNMNTTSYYNNWDVFFSSCVEGQNYISLQIFDNASNSQQLPNAFFVLKDTTPPVISTGSWAQNQWYGIPPTVNIGFSDAASGSGVQSFSVITSTAPNIPASNWTLVQTTSTYSYTANWQIPQTVFNSMASGTTNYFWVKASDFALNVTTCPQAFIVMKDTSGVTIVNGEAAGQDSVWRSTSTVRSYNVNFVSLGQSPLVSVQYTAYTQPNRQGTMLFDWKGIPEFTGSGTSFNNWHIGAMDFASLVEYTTNYISVQCTSLSGSATTYNDVFFVKKDTTAPTAPSLTQPLNASATNQTTVPFGWLASSDLSSGTTLYYMAVSTAPDFSSVIFSSYTSSLLVRAVLPQSTYYWKAEAKDAANNWSSYSSPWTVIVDTTPPNTFALSSPLDGLTTNYISPQFSWSSTTDSGPSGLSYYRLDVSTSTTFVPLYLSSSTLSTSYTLNFQQSATYYWQVKAFDNAGNSVNSNSFRTIVIDTIAPAAPLLTSPINNFTTNYSNVTLTWAATGYDLTPINNYVVQLSTTANFSTVYSSASTSSTTYSATLSVSSTYFWQVTAYDTAGNFSTNNNIYNIIFDTIPPSQGSLLSPSSGTCTNTNLINFSWNTSTDYGPAGTAGYELRTSTDPAMSIYVSSITLLTQASLSYPQGLYYWKVRAYDRAFNYGLFSSTWSVIIDTTGPTQISSLTAPLNNLTTNQMTLNFSWGAISESPAGMKNYILQVSTDPAFSIVNYSSWVVLNSAAITLNQSSYTWRVNAMDNALNYTTSTAKYFVTVDTTPPQITFNQGNTTGWINSSTMTGIGFADSLVGVMISSYTAWTGPHNSGSNEINWTTIFSSSPALAVYSSPWAVNFNLLAPGTNYISLVSQNAAGNITGLTDAFLILKDTIPPASITNLSSYQGTWPTDNAGSVTLSWAAPSDDGLTDISNKAVSGYLVKYSTFNFTSTAAFLASNATFYQIWSPQQPSATETHDVTGLFEGATYFIGIIPIDKAGNYSNSISTTSNWALRVPPGQITTLNATTGSFPGEVNLTWMDPGDNYYVGTSSGYVVKYATFSITSNALFAAATTFAQTWTPQAASTYEQYVVNGLNPGTSYYFAMEAYDAASNYSVISNTVSAASGSSGATSGIITYGDATSGSPASPSYREWVAANSIYNPNPPAAPYRAQAAASTIRYVRLQSCNVLRDQKMMGVLTYNGNTAPNGDLYLQLWDGTANGGAGGWTSLGMINSSEGNMYSTYRGFDLAYEQNSGRVLVSYFNGTTGKLSYQVWSSTQGAFVGSGTLNCGTLTGSIYWVKLKSRPGSDQIMVAASDSNSALFGGIWNGPTNSWIVSSTKTFSTALSTGTKQCFDIAWENQSGRGMILWGTGTTTDFALWSSTANVWLSTGIAAVNIGVAENWASLAADPISNRIGFSSIDSSKHWYTDIWTGTAWNTASELSTTLETNNARCADIAWENNSGNCIAVCVNVSSTSMEWSESSAGGAWSALAKDSAYNWSAYIAYLELISDPNTNKIIATGIDISGSLRTRNWSSGWSGGSSLCDTVSGWTDGTLPSYMPAQLALDLQDDVPPIITVTGQTPLQGVWINNNNAEIFSAVTFTDSGGSHLAQLNSAVYTGPQLGGAALKSFTAGSPEITGMNTDSYSTPWSLSATTFNLLQRGQNNYVSLQVSDGAGNTTKSYDVFTVWKDTEPPQISSTTVNYGWQNAGVTYSNISIADQPGLSGLGAVQYCAYTSSANAGTQVLNWTNLPISTGSTSAYTGFTIAFNLLAANTNYISMRAWDVAGNTTTVTDFFTVLKDTQPPSTPSDFTATLGPYRGTVLLTWTAPGDDGAYGNNYTGNYIIKYATYSISSVALFNASTTFIQYTPAVPAGSPDSLTLSGLATGTTFYFALESTNKANNVSGVAYSGGIMPRASNIYINEVCPTASGSNNWVELYNNTSSSFSLTGCQLYYKQGTIASSVSETSVWTGGTGLSIASGTFVVIPGLTLNGSASYTVDLRDSLNRVIDQVQWPVMPSGYSYSRISDGNANFFEANPTPTMGYANSVSTGVVCINEINYASSLQTIELYNTSSTTQTLVNYIIRNSNGVPFRFTRTIPPYGFSGFDSSSVDNSGNSWTACFGASGLKPTADFIALVSSPSGQVIDRVTWNAGSNNNYLNYQTVGVPFDMPANGGISSPNTIGRYPDGANTFNNKNDFSVYSAPSFGGRNYNPTPLASNSVDYPATGTRLPAAFKIDTALGSNVSAGYNNAIWFVRTGGTADGKSPHIFRLQDIGFNLSSLTAQTTIQIGSALSDFDGNKLINGTIYSVIYNIDNGTSAAPQITVNSVYYDATISSAVVYPIMFQQVNNGAIAGVYRIDITNNAQSGGNNIQLYDVKARFTDGSGNPLNETQVQNLITNVCLVADNLVYGTLGTYQPAIDTGTLASVSGNFITVDSSGSMDIPVAMPQGSLSTIAPQQTQTYFLGVTMANNASNQSPNTFRVKMIPGTETIWRDAPSLVTQPTNAGAEVFVPSPYIIAPASAPAGSVYPLPVSQPGKTLAVFGQPYIDGAINNNYAASSDGNIYMVSDNGSSMWTFNAGGAVTTIYDSNLEEDAPYLYAGTNSGLLYKLQNNGSSVSQVWQYPLNLGSAVSSDITYYGGTANTPYLYVGTNDGHLYKIDNGGNLVSGWITSPGINGGMFGYPVIDPSTTLNDNGVWLGTSGGSFYRVNNGDNGSITASSTTAPSIHTSPFLTVGSSTHLIYYGDDSGTLRCRYASNLNSIPAGWTDVHVSSPIRSSPYVDSGYPGATNAIYFGCDNGKFYKVDVSSGGIYWTYQTNGPIRTSPVVGNNDDVYFGSDDGYMYGLDTDDGTPTIAGFPVATGAEIRCSPIYDIGYLDSPDHHPYNDYLIFCSNDGKVYCIDIPDPSSQ